MAAFMQQHPWEEEQGKQSYGQIASAREKQKDGLNFTVQAALEQKKWPQPEQEPQDSVESVQKGR